MNPFCIFPDENLIIYQAEEEFGADQSVQFLKDLVSHPDFRPGLLEIIDLSAVRLWSLDYHELQSVAEFNRNKDTLRNEVAKLVIYAPTELAFGYARMYQSLTADFHNITVVRTWDALVEELPISSSALMRCYEALTQQEKRCVS